MFINLPDNHRVSAEPNPPPFPTCPRRPAERHVMCHGRNITIADPKRGRPLRPLWSVKWIRPLTNLTSPFRQQSCHQAVSVLAGTRQTTVAHFLLSAIAFRIHASISRPYGGFIHAVPDHLDRSPSSSGDIKFSHFAFHDSAHTSRSNPNSAFSGSNISGGVDHRHLSSIFGSLIKTHNQSFYPTGTTLVLKSGTLSASG